MLLCSIIGSLFSRRKPVRFPNIVQPRVALGVADTVGNKVAVRTAKVSDLNNDPMHWPLRPDCSALLLQAVLYPFSRSLGKRDDVHAFARRFNLPVAPCVFACHNLTIMPEDNILASMSEL
jgi:hypothetical protein